MKRVPVALGFTLLISSCGSDDFFEKITPTKLSQESEQREIIAREKIEFLGTRPGSNLQINMELSSMPEGAKLSENVLLEWQSDLQDIGKNFFATLVSQDAKTTHEKNYHLTVKAPPVVSVECSTLPEPVIGAIGPELKWHWKGWNDYKLTFSAPVAGDLDGDGEVEIVTMISTRDYYNRNGPVIVLKGKTGEVLWNSMEESGIVGEVSTTPVLVDLDQDGKSEIVVVAMDGNSREKRKIQIIDYQTKSIRSTFQEGFICKNFCIPAVADLDHDGSADIVAGNVILSHTGALKHFLIPTPLPSPRVQTVTIAELVASSPGLEIVVNGGQIYSSTGNLLWSVECTNFSAVADLDQDGNPELICTDKGFLHVYSDSGSLVWKREVMGGGNGGAPNVGRFVDGNELQVGIAGGSNYQVYNHAGNLLWATATQDLTSSSTGSTIFDFNGDGKVEVIYNDETHLRIFDGMSGEVLWAAPNISGTLWEYPIIVDLDNNQSADIVVSAPGWHTDKVASPGQGGIKVFTDPNNKWVSTRKVWNQYSYFPEIVTDSLQVVSTPVVPRHGFRVNLQGSLQVAGKILLPDLKVIAPLFAEKTSEGAQLSFFVVNQGELISTGTKRLVLKAEATGEVIAEKHISSELSNANGILVTMPVAQEKISQRLLVEIDLDANGQTVHRECNGENNSTPFDLQGIFRGQD